MRKQKLTFVTTLFETSWFQHRGERKDIYVTAERSCLHAPPPVSEIKWIGLSTVIEKIFKNNKQERLNVQ